MKYSQRESEIRSVKLGKKWKLPILKGCGIRTRRNFCLEKSALSKLSVVSYTIVNFNLALQMVEIEFENGHFETFGGSVPLTLTLGWPSKSYRLYGSVEFDCDKRTDGRTDGQTFFAHVNRASFAKQRWPNNHRTRACKFPAKSRTGEKNCKCRERVICFMGPTKGLFSFLIMRLRALFTARGISYKGCQMGSSTSREPFVRRSLAWFWFSVCRSCQPSFQQRDEVMCKVTTEIFSTKILSRADDNY